jgi:hypothetical protein
MMPPGGVRRIDRRLIHRSAWKGYSRKFACRGFCEVCPLHRIILLRGMDASSGSRAVWTGALRGTSGGARMQLPGGTGAPQLSRGLLHHPRAWAIGFSHVAGASYLAKLRPLYFLVVVPFRIADALASRTEDLSI